LWLELQSIRSDDGVLDFVRVQFNLHVAEPRDASHALRNADLKPVHIAKWANQRRDLCHDVDSRVKLMDDFGHQL
jgi:hypothetical protein